LANAGHAVTFVGRSWNIESIRESGIRIAGLWGEVQTQPQASYENIAAIPETERNFDQIFLCVKAFDTASAMEACLPVMQDLTLVISFQNGYGNCQTIAKTIGWERTLGARVITGVELPKPATVHVTVHADAIRLGHYINQFPQKHIESLTMPMKEAGIRVEATEQLEQFIWSKILYNSALNPMGALLQCNYGRLGENPETAAVMSKIVEEAFDVTHAHGIAQFWETPKDYLNAFYDTMLPPTASHFPSMLRDIQKGRKTEIDALNGSISSLGKQKSIPTPVNDTITALLHFRESNRTA